LQDGNLEDEIAPELVYVVTYTTHMLRVQKIDIVRGLAFDGSWKRAASRLKAGMGYFQKEIFGWAAVGGKGFLWKQLRLKTRFQCRKMN
jgi:hypothetical protein